MRNILKPDKKVIKPLLKLGYPVVAGNIGLVVMSLVDNAMVGALGYIPLAAVGISSTIFFVTTIFGIGTLVVFSASIAAHLKSKQIGIARFINASFFVALLITILTFLVMFLLYYNFHWFQQPAEVETVALPYFKIITFSIVPMFIYLAFKNISDGHSRTLPAMIATLSAVLLNAFLNWVLIFGHLGFSAMGIVGAGYATLISRIYMAIVMIVYIIYHPQIEYFVSSFKVKYSKQEVHTLLRLGLPSGLQVFYEVTAFAAAAVMAGWLGARFLAAHQVAIGLVSLTYMMANGVSVATMIKVGEGMATRTKTALNHIGFNSVLFASYIMIFFAIVLVVFSRPLVEIFTSDLEVIQTASTLLYIAALFQLFDGIQVVSLGILRGMGDTRIPSRIALFSYWIFALPTSYLLGFHTSLGINGIWLGLTLGLICASWLLYNRFKKLTT